MDAAFRAACARRTPFHQRHQRAHAGAGSARARAGEPWRVASSVVYRLVGADGVANINPSQPLAYALEREVRVEAQPGYKLSGVPLTLTLEYPPLHALFVATGQGLFTIASGKAGLASCLAGGHGDSGLQGGGRVRVAGVAGTSRVWRCRNDRPNPPQHRGQSSGGATADWSEPHHHPLGRAGAGGAGTGRVCAQPAAFAREALKAE